MQFGLRALQHGQIGSAQFLRLNAIVRNWKAPADIRPYRAQLEQNFPQGVCNYRQVYAAWPDVLLRDGQSQ